VPPSEQRLTEDKSEETGVSEALAAQIDVLSNRSSHRDAIVEACQRVSDLCWEASARDLEEFSAMGGNSALVRLLRADDEDIIDAAAETLASLSCPSSRKPRAAREMCVGGHTITLCEQDFSTSGTGYTVWTAALVLGEWMAAKEQQHLWKNAPRVLELGSGLGVNGILAAKLGGIVTLSDYFPPLIANLQLQARPPAPGRRIAAGTPTPAPTRHPARARRAPLSAGRRRSRPTASRGARAPCTSTGRLRRAWSPRTPHGACRAPGRPVRPRPRPCSAPARLLRLSRRPRPRERARLRRAPHFSELAGNADGRADGCALLGAAEQFPLIVAADVCYEPSHPALLSATLARRLSPGGTARLVYAVRFPVRAPAAQLGAAARQRGGAAARRR